MGVMQSRVEDAYQAQATETLLESSSPSGQVNTMPVPLPSVQEALRRLYRTFTIKLKILAWETVVASRAPLKRAVDIVGSVLLMIVLSPIFLITYLAIKLQDGGPAIFVQTRIGKWGKPFRFYKFRSMVVNAEDLKTKLIQYNEMKGITFKIKNDPRITPVGRIIRRMSIDELPQLWCVLKGDMSLVGPRPPVPGEVAMYNNSHFYRLDAVPGITCIWQVSGRNEIQFEDQVKLDVQYIHKQSLRTDIALLFKTIKAVVTARGAS